MLTSLFSNILCDIFSGNSKERKIECYSKGEPYYGLLIIVVFILSSIMFSEGILYLIFGSNTVDGILALLMVIVLALIIFALLIFIYTKYEMLPMEKKQKKYQFQIWELNQRKNYPYFYTLSFNQKYTLYLQWLENNKR